MANNEQTDEIVELQPEETKAVVGGAAPAGAEMLQEARVVAEPRKMPAPQAGSMPAAFHAELRHK